MPAKLHRAIGRSGPGAPALSDGGLRSTTSRARRCAIGMAPAPTRTSTVMVYRDAEIRWMRTRATVRPNDELTEGSRSLEAWTASESPSSTHAVSPSAAARRAMVSAYAAARAERSACTSEADDAKEPARSAAAKVRSAKAVTSATPRRRRGAAGPGPGARMVTARPRAAAPRRRNRHEGCRRRRVLDGQGRSP
jgi:hypothetical protein